MKVKFLIISVMMNVVTFAQSFYPSVYKFTSTGFDLLRTENPVIIKQVKDSASNKFFNNMLYLKYKSPNTEFIGLNKIAKWNSNNWVDIETTSDSFILDSKNRIFYAIEVIKYNYPGFNYAAKMKYIYTYDNLDRIIKIAVQTSNSVTSNAYQYTSYVTFKYNDKGLRYYDSTYDVKYKSSYINSYVYNNTNKLIIEYGKDGFDTTSKTFYSYTGDLLNVRYNTNLNTSTDEWHPYSADSFYYNNKGQISNMISWVTFFNDLGTTNFAQLSNESYQYNAANKLIEIVSKNIIDSVLKNESKIVVEYNNQNKATLAYGYKAINATDWATDANEKYIFDESVLSVKSSFENEKNYLIFPNPASQILYIEQEEVYSFEVFDITGKSVIQNTLNDKEVNVSLLPNGIYYIQLFDFDGYKIGSQKVIITH
ncbi:MAG: T9SS type A sorting domain-containing protein [Bacteroidia bacterium]